MIIPELSDSINM